MSKIIFVEDDPMIAEIYKSKLESSGFEVVNAKTGREALKYAAQGGYDLMLLDMVLPELGGMEVLKEIKSDSSYNQNLKIVIFSNLNEAETQQEALKNGADGFISKMQYSPSELVQEVSRLIRQFDQQEENHQRVSQEGEIAKSGQRILFIEDEESFLETFGKSLEGDGYVVAVASKGDWGLKEALENDYDLIVIDTALSDVSGIEVVGKLKEEAKTQNIPIVMVSASVTDEEFEQIKQLGVVGFFLKNEIAPSDFLNSVSEILKQN